MRTGDRVATIVLLVLQAAGVLVFAAAGLLIVFVSDSCGAADTTCDSGRIAWGVMTPPLVAAAFFVISLVWSIKRMAQSRLAWWVPILMTVLSVGGVVLGYVIAASGVHNGNLL